MALNLLQSNDVQCVRENRLDVEWHDKILAQFADYEVHKWMFVLDSISHAPCYCYLPTERPDKCCSFNVQWPCTVCVHAKQTSLLSSPTVSEVTCMGTHPGSRSNAFPMLCECIGILLQLVSDAEPTHLVSRLNMFAFSLGRVWLLVQTHPGCGWNSFILGANAFRRKTRYTLCLTGTVVRSVVACLASFYTL